MSFSAALRKDADTIFQAIYLHPSVQGIAQGQLRSESLIHYVSQDTQYTSPSQQVRADV